MKNRIQRRLTRGWVLGLVLTFLSSPGHTLNLTPVNDFIATEVPSHIFGNNDRLRASKGAEWKKFVGRLVNNATGSSCTASLVGKDLLITAAHCIVPANYPIEALEFQQSYEEGKMLGRSGIVQWWANAKYDYAILRLATPLGDEDHSLRQRFFKVLSVNQVDHWMEDPVMLAGYGKYFSGSEFLTAQRSCRVRSYSNFFLHHDCDIDFGDSGGPIFINHPQFGWTIVGIHSQARTRNGQMQALAHYNSAFTHFGASYWAWAPSLTKIEQGSR
ncbi:MAG: hypothetical protein A2X86_21790 [Bdellovibrionales bacterium GWA2_49_15]|nr:MAG: hypothetical protein A2X86_21790 [Bdellovibrionales bacterium GWA2_49_15]HAZ12847.1 hypothetical protein [Bdellovibrionales bacterium]